MIFLFKLLRLNSDLDGFELHFLIAIGVSNPMISRFSCSIDAITSLSRF